MSITVHRGDLPDDYQPGQVIAVDTETMGLNIPRDRLCVVQVSRGDGDADLVQIEPGQESAPNLERIFSDRNVLKIFHFARADMAVLRHWLDIRVYPVYCTKIASRFTRTNTGQHGLRSLLQDVLGIEVQKEQQCSDWGVENLTDAQMIYAASDVLHLHDLHKCLEERLERDGRGDLARNCFEFLPHRVEIDLAGWTGDIFSH